MGKISIVGILVLIGAVMALAAVFLDWVTITFNILDLSESGTGWDIFRENGTDGAPSRFMFNMPVVVLALAAIAIILALLDFLGKGNSITNIVILIIGALIIALSFLTYNEFSAFFNELDPSGAWKAFIDIKMAIGLFIEFAAGAILILASVLKLAKVAE